MQRRVTPGLPAGLIAVVCMALPLASTSARAQAPSAVRGTADAAEVPQLLLVVRRDPKTTPRDESTRIAIKEAVTAMMRGAGHYQVTVYSTTEPRIKNALLVHSISSIDLNEPLQPEGMRRLAVALGIRSILLLTPVFDKTGLRMESQLHQNVGQDAWQIGVTDEVKTDYQIGKHRLNSREAVALTVDALGARLGVPSHLAADMNVASLAAASARSDKMDRPAHPDRGTKKGKRNAASAVTDATAQAGAGDGDSAVPIVVKPRSGSTGKTREPKAASASARRTNDKKPRAPAITVVTAPTPGTVQNPRTPHGDVPTVQTTAHVNYETLADHYHDNKDLANTITLLRYAINERPRDIGLRRKLILAYQERRMPETALAEIGRALQIAPNEGILYRAYGDTLLSRGDVPGAQKAYRDAVRLNADDIPARIALGDSLMLDNQYSEAMEVYGAAEKADPHSPLPHRRLARALLQRAASDPAQYAASLEETGKARDLTPKGDTAAYQEDYGILMQITESRLRELLEEISGNLIALTKGKQSGSDTLRALSDIQIRTDAINAYLDKAPPAVGQDLTQNHYQQSGTLLLLTITLFRNYVSKVDANVKQQMQDAQAEAYQELDAAHKRLAEIRAVALPK